MKFLLTIWILCGCGHLFAATIPAGRGTSLRAAIERAMDGDTVIVHSGHYREGNIIIGKSIALLGSGKAVLDGEGKHEILTISGNNIVIRGLHFANAGYSSMYDYAAIKILNSKGVMVEDNEVHGAFFAIHFANSTQSVVRNNRIRSHHKTEQSSGNGIHLWKCSNMAILNNTISGHRDGIYFEFVTNSVIQNNKSIGNIRYGLHFMFSNDDVYAGNVFRDNGAGVAVMFSKKVTMYKNHFDHNWGPSAYGLLLKEISDSHIEQNHFEENSTAIHMEGTNRITVRRNDFTSNGWAMRVQASCSDNNFFENNYVGNTFDVATNGSSMLNHFSNNYWDKYEGYDLDRNGIGDVLYRPVTMYSMVIEQNPNALLLLRSFMVTLLDRAERSIPSLTPEHLVDQKPVMKPYRR